MSVDRSSEIVRVTMWLEALTAPNADFHSNGVVPPPLPLDTVTAAVAEAVAPLSSVTVRRAWEAPAAPYAWVVDDPVPVWPSPKSQAYVAIVPSGSLEPTPLNEIGLPTVPLYGPPACAIGGWLVPPPGP